MGFPIKELGNDSSALLGLYLYMGETMKKLMKLYLITFLSLFLFASCQQKNKKQSYEAEINEWFKQHEQRLASPDSWLSLAGLFWLKEGENTFGSDKSNTVVFPEGKAVPFLGSFYVREGKVKVILKKGLGVTIDDEPIREATLLSDADGKATMMKSGSLSWYVIKRGEQFLIRLKDSENPAITNFAGINRYPVDKKWRVRARLEPYDPPKKIETANMLGQLSYDDCPGALVFQINDIEYRLDPLGKPGNKTYFLIFSDGTSGRETYGAGRYLSIEAPDSTGFTYIEFNKAYNPPCAFSPYATCPLPPRQNHISAAIKAGEKDYGNH